MEVFDSGMGFEYFSGCLGTFSNGLVRNAVARSRTKVPTLLQRRGGEANAKVALQRPAVNNGDIGPITSTIAAIVGYNWDICIYLWQSKDWACQNMGVYRKDWACQNMGVYPKNGRCNRDNDE